MSSFILAKGALCHQRHRRVNSRASNRGVRKIILRLTVPRGSDVPEHLTAVTEPTRT